MNAHFKLVTDFNDALSPATPGKRHLSDMDIITQQALLMARGGQMFDAIHKGEMADILRGMTSLAHGALLSIAKADGQITERPVFWRHDGSVISVMRLFMAHIAQCASGEAAHYSALYCVCRYLTASFLNADFDNAFRVVHQVYLAQPASDLQHLDLSDCLYE